MLVYILDVKHFFFEVAEPFEEFRFVSTVPLGNQADDGSRKKQPVFRVVLR